MSRLLTTASRQAAKSGRLQVLATYGATVEEAPGITLATWERGTDRQLFSLEYWEGNAGNSTYITYQSEARRTQVIENLKAHAARKIEYKARRKEENKGKSSGHAAAAAAIKEALKKEFTGVKFSVTSESFAGGDAVRIHWQDGPTVGQVEAISGQFQQGHFDGMTDMYEYSNNNDNLPQVKYVTESRSMSEEVEEQLGQLFDEGNYFVEEHGHWAKDRQIYRLFAATSLPIGAKITGLDNEGSQLRAIIELAAAPAAAERPAPIEVPAGKIQVIDYSDKALAVIGDTRTIKDKLKELGGRFNPRLTCGPGWIFSKKQAEQLKAAFM